MQITPRDPWFTPWATELTPLRGSYGITSLLPMADAMGYRTYAAPRLVRNHVPVTHG